MSTFAHRPVAIEPSGIGAPPDATFHAQFDAAAKSEDHQDLPNRLKRSKKSIKG
jgi:hypothetical protein